MASEAFFLPFFTLVSIVVSYIAVSIVLSKVHAVGFLASGDRGDWLVNLTASNSDVFSIDEGMSNKVIYINLDAYMAGWESGFPFQLFDPRNVVEGTSLTIFNSPASNIGSTVNVSYINSAGVEVGSSALCYSNSQANQTGSCPCPVPGNKGPDDAVQNWCNANCGGSCENCTCNNICTPKNPIALSAILGRGQGVTVMVQRRIPNVNVAQPGGTCFYYDITPPELQPRDWVVVRYYGPSTTTQCGSVNSVPSGSSPTTTVCNNYTIGSNSIFSDNIPSALIWTVSPPNPWRQNGSGPAYRTTPSSAQNLAQWQDCYAVDCGCTGLGLWCDV